MKNPKNHFKASILSGAHQLGMWNSIGGNTVAELLGGAGYDWVLIDCEHSAIETVEVLPALQALAAVPEVTKRTSASASSISRIRSMCPR